LSRETATKLYHNNIGKELMIEKTAHIEGIEKIICLLAVYCYARWQEEATLEERAAKNMIELDTGNGCNIYDIQRN
jgi:hypothetical protein